MAGFKGKVKAMRNPVEGILSLPTAAAGRRYGSLREGTPNFRRVRRSSAGRGNPGQ